MPRLTKIYTRKGDDGSTALGTKLRVAKNSTRVAAYGEVDELNSQLGFAISLKLPSRSKEILIRIQHELLVLGAELAFPADETEVEIPHLEDRHIEQLEQEIDDLNEALGPLENFILPGGAKEAAALQVSRTVCRRAERRMVELAGSENVRSATLAYINRLSDLLFVLARFENKKQGGPEILWNSHI